eukprot:CAMPEP_0117070482 /NCGR_PEP_ID=MMETSP0472-20121206/49518_1 /TAXON_ID=693140 ORGANISM="Tiarina fusus, Strain LIS" /NCGR_SAMPLE_ID=MMETSP0472 /ASSEMBLY_ACC=CAM_ASM_000603 /LENGTH=473 /DNA_ID=CAMNT_0004793607 /DNA_START=63 /DNA_END=1481 /DNA_ORIENTATION=-
MTRILIGPKQRNRAEEILEKKTKTHKTQKKDDNSLILHMFQLEVDDDLANIFMSFLKTQFCQRIRIERCSGMSLGKLLQACLSSCVDLEVEDMEEFPTLPTNHHARSQLGEPDQCIRLERLSLKSMSLNGPAASFVERAGSTVSVLRFQQCQILLEDSEVLDSIGPSNPTMSNTVEDSEAMIRSLRTKPLLRRLDLSQCQLSAPTMEAVLRSLASSCKDSLTELDISENDLSEEDAVLALRDLIVTSKHLKKLHTAKVRLASIRPLAQSLESNLDNNATATATSSSLTFWNLSGNELTTDDMRILATALTRNATLETLYVHDNHFDDGILESIISGNNGLRCGVCGFFRILPCPSMAFKDSSEAFADQTNLYDLQVPKMLVVPPGGGVTAAATTDKGGQEVHRHQSLLLQSYQQNICYWGELNRNGRYLLSRDIPLGLWPLVLAKAASPASASSTPATLLERIQTNTCYSTKM